MLRSLPVRLVLGVVMVGGLSAVSWSLLSRRTSVTDQPDPGLLAEGVKRRITEFEYVERKKGRPIFRVEAAKSTLNSRGLNELETVELHRFDPAGDLADKISGLKAVYDTESGQIKFEESVEVELFNGTRLYSQTVQADLHDELVWIRDAFEFRKGNLSGAGTSLEYRIAEQRFDIDRLDGLQISAGEQPLSARARRAEYDLRSDVIRLFDEVRIEGRSEELRAGRVTVFLNQSDRLRRVEAVEDAELRPSSNERFEGHQINLEFGSAVSAWERVEVLGARGPISVGQRRLARYRQQFPDTYHELRAVQIEGRPNLSGAASPVGALADIEAIGEVGFVSPKLKIEKTEAEEMRIRFWNSGGIREVELEGNVFLQRRLDGSAGVRQENLHCESLTVGISSMQQMQRAEARNSVWFETVAGPSRRSLSSRDFTVFNYRDGLLDTIESGSSFVLESLVGEQRLVLRGHRLEAGFESGRISRVDGTGDVELELRRGSQWLRSRSESIEMRYSAARLEQVRQVRQVHLWERSGARSIEVDSAEAQYDAGAGDQVVFSGEERPRLVSREDGVVGAVKTIAAVLRYRRSDGSLIGEGAVESVFETGGGTPIFVSAGEMETDPATGTVRFRRDPRLVQGTNVVRAQEIELLETERGMVARGDVRSRFVEVTPEGLKEYEAEAETLQIAENGKASYRGQAHLTGEALSVKAPLIEVYFSDSEGRRMERIEASGGAEILENGRQWKGSRAIYYRREERVVVDSGVDPGEGAGKK